MTTNNHDIATGRKCIACALYAAQAHTELCSNCEPDAFIMQEKITSKIKDYENCFRVSFCRTDEVFFDDDLELVSNGEIDGVNSFDVDVSELISDDPIAHRV